MRYRRLFGLLGAVVLTVLFLCSLVQEGHAAVPEPGEPRASWSLSAQLVIPAQEVALRGASRAKAERLDPVVAKMGAAGLAVTVREVPGAVDGMAFQVQGSSSGTLEQFRRLIYLDLKPEVNVLAGVTELNITSGGAQSLTSEVVLAANPSTGYLWTVAKESGFSESARPGFVTHTRGVGVAQHQILHLRNTMNQAPVKLVYRRPWLTDPATIQIRLELDSLPARLDLGDPGAPTGPVGPPDVSSTGEGAFPVVERGALPSSLDWRASGIVTPVRDQSTCGSCWSFGTVGIMESALGKSGAANVDLSEQFLVSCNTSGWGCDGGLTAHRYHYDRLGKNQTALGAVLEAEKPYRAENGTCSTAYNHPYRLNNWQFIVPSEFQMPTVDQIKSAIYSYGPITAGVCVGDGFTSYTGGVFASNESSLCNGTTNHQIILVGWNDNGGNGYWILRNSWGNSWGMNGYMHIAYNTSRVGEGTSWVTTAPAAAEFSLAAAPAAVTVALGGSRSTTISSTVSGGFASSVALAISGLPTGVSATFAPATLGAPGSGSSTLTFTAGANAAAGTYPVSVIGTGGGVTRSATVTLRVSSGETSVLFSNGFESGEGWSYFQATGSTALWGLANFGTFPSAQPHGGSVMALFNSYTATNGDQALCHRSTSFAVPSSAETVTLKYWMYHDTGYPDSMHDTIRPYISTDGVHFSAAGPAVARYDGSSGWREESADFTAYRGQADLWLGFLGTSNYGNNIYLDDVSVEAQGGSSPDFALSAAASTVSVPAGGTGGTTLTATVSGGFNSGIALSASGLPSGVSIGFAPATIAAPGAGSSVLTFSVAGSAVPGGYPVTLSATGGGRTHQVALTLLVTVPPSFSLSAAPESLTVARGGSGSTTITSTVSGGFNSAVTLWAAGLPSGVSASFAPSSIGAPGSGASTLTFSVAAATPAGSYPVTVTGTGGAVSRSVTVTLSVPPGLPPRFSIPGRGTFHSFSDMCSILVEGSSVVAQAADVVIEESIALVRNLTLSLKGGYDATFTNVTGRSVIAGAVIVRQGKMVMDKFIIR